jgi:hypothetical protein
VGECRLGLVTAAARPKKNEAFTSVTDSRHGVRSQTVVLGSFDHAEEEDESSEFEV